MAMVRVRNVSDGPVVVGEKYLDPGESRLLDSGWAAVVLAQHPAQLAGEAVGEEAFWDGEEPPRAGDGVTEEGGHSMGGHKAAPLRAIRGIGPRVEEALHSLGVDSYAALVGWDAGVLAAALDGSSLAQVERWQAEAHKLMTRLDG